MVELGTIETTFKLYGALGAIPTRTESVTEVDSPAMLIAVTSML